jgi:hypothetical protein
MPIYSLQITGLTVETQLMPIIFRSLFVVLLVVVMVVMREEDKKEVKRIKDGQEM